MMNSGSDAFTHECYRDEDFKQIAINLVEIKGELKALNVRINGSFEKIGSFMEASKFWRAMIISIIISMIAAATSWSYWIISFSADYGSSARQIEINTNRLDHLEGVNRAMDARRG